MTSPTHTTYRPSLPPPPAQPPSDIPISPRRQMVDENPDVLEVAPVPRREVGRFSDVLVCTGTPLPAMTGYKTTIQIDEPPPPPVLPPVEPEPPEPLFISPEVARNVIDMATFNGALGRGHQKISEASSLLTKSGTDSTVFKLAGATRWEKFTNTVVTFTKGGACLGAFLSDNALKPMDCIFGNGTKRGRDEEYSLLDKGILGHSLEWMTAGVGSAFEVLGGGIGAVAGTVDLPARSMGDSTVSEWYKTHMLSTKEVFGKAATMSIGSLAGSLLDFFRFGSLALKYIFSTIMAGSAFFAGIFGGAARALINQ